MTMTEKNRLSTLDTTNLSSLVAATFSNCSTLLCQQFPELVMPNGDPEAQYQIGIYWLERKDSLKAERWIRYAARQGHTEAIRLLRAGSCNGFFRDDKHHIISSAIDVLETFITPEPSQADIDTLSQLLEGYLYTLRA